VTSELPQSAWRRRMRGQQQQLADGLQSCRRLSPTRETSPEHNRKVRANNGSSSPGTKRPRSVLGRDWDMILIG